MEPSTPTQGKLPVRRPITLGRFWFGTVAGVVSAFGALGIAAKMGNFYLDKKYGKFECSVAKLFEVKDDEDED